MRKRTNQIRADFQYNESGSLENNFTKKIRLNLNDLLRRHHEEKKVDKKVNVFILSGVTTVAVVLFIILSL